MFGAHVALGCWAAAALFGLGTTIDSGVLWLAQHQPTVEWEFVALTRSIDAVPRAVLSVALVYAALFFGGRSSMLGYRLVAAALLLIGTISAALGAMLVMDYFIIVDSVAPDAVAVFRSTVFKALALVTMYVAVLFPLGLLGLRRPRS
ncbi:MAG TPA: hypothetical protein VGA37_10860 [Gemmatimonadales bacterium]|jgi:hypothetical protein